MTADPSPPAQAPAPGRAPLDRPPSAPPTPTTTPPSTTTAARRGPRRRAPAARGPADGDPKTIRFSRRVAIYFHGRSYYLRYTLAGRQRRERLGTDSLKQARKLAELRDAELVTGRAAPASSARRVAVADAVGRFLQASAHEGLDPKTLRAYAHELRQFEAYAAGRGVARLDQLEATLLLDYAELLRTDGFHDYPGEPRQARSRKRGAVAATTLNRKMMLAKGLTARAVALGLLGADPFAAVRLPPKRHDERHCFAPAEVARVRDALAEPFRSAFLFMVGTGLRLGELCWLRREDVDLAERVVRVRRKAGWRPKHGREREVPLLDEHVVAIARRQASAGPGPWLFTPPPATRRPLVTEADRRLREKHVWETLRRALTKLGIAGSTHSCRHTFATFAAASGIEPYDLREAMGHEKLETTMAYFHGRAARQMRGRLRVDFAQLIGPAAADAAPASAPTPQQAHATTATGPDAAPISTPQAQTGSNSQTA